MTTLGNGYTPFPFSIGMTIELLIDKRTYPIKKFFIFIFTFSKLKLINNITYFKSSNFL